MNDIGNLASSFYNPNALKPREIHIWEFPKNFYFKLEPKLMHALVNRAAKQVGGLGRLASILNVHYDTVRQYRNSNHSISLAALRKLCELAGSNFTIERIERSIVSYKGGSRVKRPIMTLELPIIETPALFALMGYLTGDGGYSSSAYYTNTNETLINEFLRLLHIVFGKVPVRVVVEKRDSRLKSIIRVKFGLTLIRLLRHLYMVDFRTHTANVPPRLYELPREYTGAYLRAFADDEGCVQEGMIILSSANKKLLQDIKKLIQMKFPKMDKYISIYNSSDGYHAVSFRPGAFGLYTQLHNSHFGARLQRQGRRHGGLI